MEPVKPRGLIKHIPNALTVARLIMALVFLGMILYAGDLPDPKPADLLMTAFALFVIAGLTDIVDGWVARAWNATSRFGRTVDPLADKFLVCGAFICFAIVGRPLLYHFHFPAWLDDTIRWGAAVVLFSREVVVQTLRHIAESRGVNFGAVVSGKIKMFLQSFGIGTVLIGWSFVSRAWGDWFTLITYILMVAFTIYSGIESLRRPIK